MGVALVWRWGLSAMPAIGITIGLFLVMIILIKTGDRVNQKVKTFSIKDVVMPDRQVDVIDIPDPEPPPDLSEPPDLPQPQPDQTVEPVNTTFSRPSVDSSVNFSGGIVSQNSELIPIVRVNPTYPQRAAQRGIEGWVVLEFTIDTDGRTKAARVIDNEPSNIFDSAALRAISKWRYRPRVVDGVPEEVEGAQVKLTFNLTKSSGGSRSLF